MTVFSLHSMHRYPDNSPQRQFAPQSTNLTMFLLFVVYRGFLRTLQYYMFLLFTSYKRFFAVLKLKCLNKVYKCFSAVFKCLNKVYESSASTFLRWTSQVSIKGRPNSAR